MRIATITALGLVLASSSAWAQSTYSDSSRNDGYRTQDQSERTGGDSYRHHWERGGGQNDDHSSYGKTRHTRGASLYLKNGDKEFRVDCGDDDSTRECVDAAMLMFREMHGTTATSTSATSGSSSSATPGATGGSSTGR
jgi:hypothetical protein